MALADLPFRHLPLLSPVPFVLPIRSSADCPTGCIAHHPLPILAPCGRIPPIFHAPNVPTGLTAFLTPTDLPRQSFSEPSGFAICAFFSPKFSAHGGVYRQLACPSMNIQALPILPYSQFIAPAWFYRQLVRPTMGLPLLPFYRFY